MSLCRPSRLWSLSCWVHWLCFGLKLPCWSRLCSFEELFSIGLKLCHSVQSPPSPCIIWCTLNFDHVDSISHRATPLALVLAGSQSQAGSAYICNPSLSTLESQTSATEQIPDLDSLQCAPETAAATRTQTRTWTWELELETRSDPSLLGSQAVWGRNYSSLGTQSLLGSQLV